MGEREVGDQLGIGAEDRRGQDDDGLRAKLLEVVLRRLSLAIDEGNWDEAFARAKAVAGRFPEGV